MRMNHRPQASWVKKPDNSQLVIECDFSKLEKARNYFSYGYEEKGNQFWKLYKYLASPYQINQNITLVDKVAQLEQAIKQLLEDQFVIVDVFDEKMTSYKGYAAWMLVGNSTVCYLIDSLTLREHMTSLELIMENGKIFKFMYNIEKTTNRLKRDFSIFPLNIFQLYEISILQAEVQEQQKQYEDLMRVQLDLRPEALISRPISAQLRKIFNFRLAMLVKCIKFLPQRPNTSSYGIGYSENIYQNCLAIYRNSNQSEEIQAPYVHKRSEFFDYSLQAKRYEEKYSASQAQIQREIKRQKSLYDILMDFREHVGRMNDVCVSTVIPDHILVKICEAEKISVLEISHFYEQRGLNPGMETCQRIYQVTKLNQERIFDEEMITEKIFKQSSKKQEKDKDPNITLKKLLKQISWGDSSEWLNRKDDPSLKLYKQIISVDQFDHSIGEQFLEGMKSNVIKKQDLGKFLKYGQFMRNKNVDKLRDYVERKKRQQEEQRQSDKRLTKKQEEEDNQDQFFQRKGSNSRNASRSLFGSEQEDLPIASSTSLEDRISGKEHSINTNLPSSSSIMKQSSNGIEDKSQNTRSRKSSETSSIRISELDEMDINRADIKPLLNSLQQIYSLAQEVKKKVDKKVSKKKDKKMGKQSSKDIEFVPTWQDINKALYMDSSSLN